MNNIHLVECAAALLIIVWACPGLANAQDHIVIGAGASAMPAYEGADSYRVLPIPIVDASHGRFLLNNADGLGIKIIQSGPLMFGVSVTYVAGYRRRDAPAGVGRLSDAAGGRLFGAYQKNGFRLELGATKSLAGGTRGITSDATMSYTAKIGPRFSLASSVATTWANGKYNDRYFGIDGAQSQPSGLDTFSPGSGFKDVSAGLTAKYAMSPRWIVFANATARGVVGNDADSPIVQHRWQPLGSIGLGHAF